MICYWDIRRDYIPNPRPSDKQSLKFLDDFRRQAWQGMEYAAWAWYESKYRTPVAAGGFIFAGQERAEAFIILSENYAERKLYFHRMVKKIFSQFLKENESIKEIYAYVDKNHPERCRWVERFGFKKTEKTINRYNIDWWVYRWDSLPQ